MNGEISDNKQTDESDDVVETDDVEDVERIPDVADDDNVGDISVEINVEELVAKLESTDDDDVSRKRAIRGRLDELDEQRKAEEGLDSTYNFNLDDELD